MDPTTRKLIESLSVLYVEDKLGAVNVVCSSTQPQLDGIIAAIESLNIVRQVIRGNDDGSYLTLKVTFTDQESLDPQRLELCYAFKARYTFGSAKGRVIRTEDGMHRDTVLQFTVSLWAASSVLARLSRIEEIRQYYVSEARYSSRSTTTIDFTLCQPTRDTRLNRMTVAKIAEALSIRLNCTNFEITDEPTWAAMSGCNLPGDPVDGKSAI